MNIGTSEELEKSKKEWLADPKGLIFEWIQYDPTATMDIFPDYYVVHMAMDRAGNVWEKDKTLNSELVDEANKRMQEYLDNQEKAAAWAYEHGYKEGVEHE